MKTKTLFTLMALISGITTPRLVAQCSFDPIVTGNLLVCPESSTTLSTQLYTSYQWYQRAYPNGTPQPIPGATGQTLTVDAAETPVYIYVRATLDTCSENSPEVLVDGLAFLPVTIASEGSFEIGANGEQIICVGDTIYQILQLPYTTNIQWYDGDDPIPGANNDTLVVTEPGNYWVTASPGNCPDYTASLGLQIPVVWGNSPGCTTGVNDPIPPFEVIIAPNPAESSLMVGVDINGPVRLILCDLLGQTLREAKFEVVTEISTSGLSAGIYTLLLQTTKGQLSRQVMIK